MKQRLKCFYKKTVISQLLGRFHYKNIHKVPRVEKIVINRGLGEIRQNRSLLKSSLQELKKITGQCRIIKSAQKDISSFKIRKRKTPVAVIVTLRGVRIYAFLDRLMNLALPRIRDFQGVNYNRFDGYGNYSIGFKEQMMFPEIDYEKIKTFHGINLSIVTSAKNDIERRVLLEILGIPFKK